MDKSMRWLLGSATFIAVALVFFTAIAMKGETERALNEILPTIQSNLEIEKSVDTSFSLLNQFLISKDEQYAKARRALWRDNVLQNLTKIQNPDLTDSLKRISDWQEQIETVGNTPENNPLKLKYDLEAQLVFENLIQEISHLKAAMIEINDERIMAQLSHLSTLFHSIDKLFDQPESKKPVELNNQLKTYWQTVLPVAEQIRQYKRRYEANTQKNITVFLINIAKYRTLTEGLLSRAQVESTNLSQFWMAKHAKPLYQTLLQQFSTFNQTLNDSLEIQREKITGYFIAAVSALFVLLTLAFVLIYVQSQQLKRLYLEPLREFILELNEYSQQDLITSYSDQQLTENLQKVLDLISHQQFEISMTKAENQSLEHENAFIKNLVEQLTHVLEKHNTLQGVAQQAIEFMRILLGAEYGIFYVVDARQKWLVRYGAIGLDAEQMNQNQVPIHEGSIGECARELKLLHRREQRYHVQYTPPAENQQYKPLIEKLFVPMTSGQSLKGVMEFGTQGEFHSKQIPYLSLLVSILALSIELTHNRVQ